jgi:hypothetical protein
MANKPLMFRDKTIKFFQFHKNRVSKTITYEPQPIKWKFLGMIGNQILPDYTSAIEEEVRKHDFTFRPNLNI